MLNPTLNLQTREFASLPIMEHANKNAVDETVNENIKITKIDWDSFETSWDFTQHPLLSKIDEHNQKSPPIIDTISDVCQKSAKFRRRINKYG